MSDENMMFATEEMQREASGSAEDSTAEIATRKFLTFRTDNLLFGVEAENVVEIITNHVITQVPIDVYKRQPCRYLCCQPFGL